MTNKQALITVLAPFVALVIFLYILNSIYVWATRAYEQLPCSEFSETAAKNLPARCMRYFSDKL